jgi:hypothetical protein
MKVPEKPTSFHPSMMKGWPKKLSVKRVSFIVNLAREFPATIQA